ncbi:MAG: lysophospholipid acyltransferase family protein [Myxococcota bacterium]
MSEDPSMRWSFVDPEVADRIDRLELSFGKDGYDHYGVAKDELKVFLTVLKQFYRNYFKVRSVRIQEVPERGRALLVGNHSGGLPVDAGMVLSSLILDHEPPRLAHGMVEKFVQEWPIVSTLFQRCGQFAGLPENAVRLLEDERILMVFPEGARGTGKLYRDRYRLVRFGTGFMRLALQTHAPIVPFAFVGGEEAIPVIYHAPLLAKLFRAPYVPITPYLLPLPRPVPCEIYFGAPMVFQGTGTESDEVIQGYVDQVQKRITELIDEGLAARGVSLERPRA